MRRSLAAVLIALSLATPALPQATAAPPATVVVGETTAPIPVEEEAPPGSSTPGPVGVAAGVFVAVVFIGLATFAVALASLGSS
jgi:hypothetical protein